MISNSFFPGLLFAIGISGLIWTFLEQYTSLSPEKVDAFAVVIGLTIAFIYSLKTRYLVGNVLFDLVTLGVLILSYFMVKSGSKKLLNKK